MKPVAMNKVFKTIEHNVDFCVVGGGLSGMCAAIAAARNGLKVAILQDRSVFGGNASSEIRMWICGAQGMDNKETGIIEELMLENRYRNPDSNYSVWDSILYEKIRFEPNITAMLLNCTCNDVEMEGNRIKAVRGWQMTSQLWHRVCAAYFADCSGDSVLAPLTGAEYRVGREGRSCHHEDIAPEIGDQKTMGSSCLIQTRQTSRPRPFTPPSWAYRYTECSCLGCRNHGLNETQNFWWLEIGGQMDTIHDAEAIRDELFKIAYGVWDHIKNHCKNKDKAANWALDWVGTLPGKRESRRYVGDYILTQNDVRDEGTFEDVVAYGGWPMDDHHPEGFNYKDDPTVFHAAPSPFGIPYRCLYSRNIENLFFAGRNISVTHAALSSTRVMATCALLGQAVGTACAVAAQEKTTPWGVYERGLTERLRQLLMDDDCYLPWTVRRVWPLTSRAALHASSGDPEPLRNGIDRSLGDVQNGWIGQLGDWVEYAFDRPVKISGFRIVFDSDLNRLIRKNKLSADQVNGHGDPAASSAREMPCCYPLETPPKSLPASLVKSFRIEAKDAAGQWQTVYQERENYQRLVKKPLQVETTAVRLIPESTWGNEQVKVFAWDIR